MKKVNNKIFLISTDRKASGQEATGDFVSKLGLEIRNDPLCKSTFPGTSGESRIDISLGISALANRNTIWSVEEWTNSDHRVIVYDINCNQPVNDQSRPRINTKNAVILPVYKKRANVVHWWNKEFKQ